MNPGVWVAGGGGDGGGGSGGAGKGKGDKAGAGAGSGDEGAQGGAQNAGACGQGSGGGCPNPKHGGGGGTQAGHPIDPVTGRVYTLAVVDLALPGAFPFTVSRAYSTEHCRLDVGLGYGWNHSLGWQLLELRSKKIRIITENAQRCEINRPELDQSIKCALGTLHRTKDAYFLTPSDGITRIFEAVHAVRRTYRLSRMVDRNGNQARLFYANDTGPLETINDSVGRLLRVLRHPSGLIAAFEVRNASEGNAWTSFRTYEYDSARNLTAATDALGQTTRYAYDEAHRLIREEWPTGLQVHYRYDRSGRCFETWCTDPNENLLLAPDVPAYLADGAPAKGFMHVRVEYYGGDCNVFTSRAMRNVSGNPFGKADQISWAGHLHENKFDEVGELIGYKDGLGREWAMGNSLGAYRVVNPLGQSTLYRYNGNGDVVATQTPDGQTTEHRRDSQGNLTRLVDGLGEVASFGYDNRGCLVSAETADGARTQMEYDALCNRVQIIEPDGAARRLKYDFLGRLIQMTDAKGGVHRWTYDAMGRQTEYCSPLGARTLSYYDAMGRFAGRRNADGLWFRLHYAGLNEVVAVERSDGSCVRYAYDRELAMVQITNEQGDVHTMERDLEGRIRKERTFDGRNLVYRNDEAGRLARVDFGNNEFSDIEYDVLDRIVGRTYSDGTFHKLEYDERGRVQLFETDEVRTRYGYDLRGRCIREESELRSDADSASVLDHHYDTGMRRIRSDLWRGWQFSTPRDPCGRTTCLSIQESKAQPKNLAAFSWDATGSEMLRRFSNTAGVVSQRDADGNVTSSAVLGKASELTRPGEPVWVGAQQGAETLRLDYQWSPAGELKALADRDRGVQHFTYDGRARIAARHHPLTGETERYSLSARGDLMTIAGRSQVHGQGGRLVESAGTKLEYDDRGRLKQKTAANGTTTYEWGVRGFLNAVNQPDGSRVEFVYDGFARRLEKRVFGSAQLVRHRYRWDSENLIEELIESRPRSDQAAPFAFMERRRYAYIPESPVPVAQAVDTPSGVGTWMYLVHRDGAPIPLALVDGDGRVEQSFEHEAYGRVTEGDPMAALSRFPGHWYEPETGLHYNRWRYFDPETGTYLSPEPLGLEGGTETYSYVMGRPLSLVDPDGLKGCTVKLYDGSGKEIGSGESGSSTPLHPAVAAALPVANAREVGPGGATDASSCAEPAALSKYLKKWQDDNGGASCDPGTLQGRQNLHRALSGIGSISSKMGSTPMAACPNCSQTLSRLWALAEPPLPSPIMQPGQAASRDTTQIPGGYQNPQTGRTIPKDGKPPVVLSPSPLSQQMNSPSMKAANQAEYLKAGGTGSVAGLNPGVFDDSSGKWAPRP